MMRVSKSKNDHVFHEGDVAGKTEKIGNAALMLAMIMIIGSIFFLIVAFAKHEY